jgi:hypothetical protein
LMRDDPAGYGGRGGRPHPLRSLRSSVASEKAGPDRFG